jgi:hypothetical protein
MIGLSMIGFSVIVDFSVDEGCVIDSEAGVSPWKDIIEGSEVILEIGVKEILVGKFEVSSASQLEGE